MTAVIKELDHAAPPFPADEPVPSIAAAAAAGNLCEGGKFEARTEPSMTTRRAECSCGQLSATCAGEPVRISVCHCLACKRRTGSAFSFNARFAEDNVSIAGRSREHTRIGDEGSRITYSFC